MATSLKGAILSRTGNQDRRPHGAADGPKKKRKRKKRGAQSPLALAMVGAATK